MLSLHMQAGDLHGLKDMHSILLSASVAKALLGDENPLNKLVSLNNKVNVKVTGVYTDLPENSSFKNMSFFAPWDMYAASNDWVKESENSWDNNSFQIYAQLKEGADFAKVSANPASPFDYKFVDDEYAKKFGDEERIGKLASFFAVLAVLISCLGLFGLASFVAEQRTKEIGVRKVLGASLFAVWRLLSKEFVLLVVISLLLAIPIAYYVMLCITGCRTTITIRYYPGGYLAPRVAGR